MLVWLRAQSDIEIDTDIFWSQLQGKIVSQTLAFRIFLWTPRIKNDYVLFQRQYQYTKNNFR